MLKSNFNASKQPQHIKVKSMHKSKIGAKVVVTTLAPISIQNTRKANKKID